MFGSPLVAAACLAGHSRLATALRRLAAPCCAVLREHPELVYAATAAAVLIVIGCGPIPATQKALPVLVMLGVMIIGVEALRRQTPREFPPAAATGDEHAPAKVGLDSRTRPALWAVREGFVDLEPPDRSAHAS